MSGELELGWGGLHAAVGGWDYYYDDEAAFGSGGGLVGGLFLPVAGGGYGVGCVVAVAGWCE